MLAPPLSESGLEVPQCEGAAFAAIPVALLLRNAYCIFLLCAADCLPSIDNSRVRNSYFTCTYAHDKSSMRSGYEHSLLLA